MQIRLAFPNEIDQIMLLIEEARAEIAKTGSDQWQKEDGYPNRNDIIDDILNGYAWVGIEDGMLATYAAVIDGHEEVYDAIYEGKWLHDNHRYLTFQHTFDAEAFSIMKKGTTIINFARAELVNNQELFEAIETGVVKRYITDFGDKELLNQKGITVFPHVGGSTDEAELNCAIMASQTIRCFMETGEITNSVNFPNVHQIQTAPFRITLINKNVPNIMAKISTAVSVLGINIDNIINRSKGDYAYTLIDLDETDNNKISTLIEEFEGDENIVRVRLIAKQQ